ncbi:hypothetical protein ACIRBX_12375 [Kitasatospora sp. NPDC096147]|uniref:hypothetical protein n=1 Tax=Kitasatospora sp. NPDC096147 TaxID=3364093 RepID=UPI003809A288
MESRGMIVMVFVDEADGLPLGKAEYPAEELPEFRPGAGLGVGEHLWEVLRTEPADRAGVLAAGRAVVSVRRVEKVDPRLVGYTIPTMLADLPPLVPAVGGSEDDLVIHEDDWRQVELIERRQLAGVEAELRAVRRIWAENARRLGSGGEERWGFTELHQRRGPAEPLVGALTLERLYALLPVSRTYEGVALRQEQGRVADSFAVEVGSAVLYGRSVAGRVSALGLVVAVAPGEVPGLAGLMAEYDLVLVDWCAARSTGAEGEGP